MMTKINNLILYHGPNCQDGFCSAWIVSNQLLLDNNNNNNEFKPCNYGDDLNWVEEMNYDYYDNIFVLDFSFDPSIIQTLIQKTKKKFVLLDHHKTAEQTLGSNLERFSVPDKEVIIKFDTTKCGARLTWEYFDPNNPPWIINYVEDRDLWKWELLYSKEINASLYSYPKEFEIWNELIKRDPKELKLEGEAIIRYQDTLINQAIKHKFDIMIDGLKIPITNTPFLQSEIAGALANNSNKIGACFYMTSMDQLRFSLRSTADGPDVSEICKKYGGGGHKNAAGFESKLINN